MSVTNCYLLRYGRSGSIAPDGRHRYGALYRVETNDPTDEWLVVKYQAQIAQPHPLPKFRQVYDLGSSIDYGAFAQTFDGTQGNENHAKVWTVRVGWAELPAGEVASWNGDNGSPIEGIPFENPLDKPDVFFIEDETYTDVMEVDADGFPVLNAAGFPYPSPVTREYSREVFVWVKRFATVDEVRNLNLSHRLTTNSLSFAGYPAGHCLCRPIRLGAQLTSNNQTFYEATIRVAAQNRPWNEPKAEYGWKHFQYIDPFGGHVESNIRVVEARDYVAEAGVGAGDGQAGSEVVLSSEPVRLINDPARPLLRGFRESEYNFAVGGDNYPTTWTTTWVKYPPSDLNDLGVSLPS